MNPPRSFPFATWLLVVTAAESLGFLAPGLLWFAAWRAEVHPLVLWAMVSFGGGVEGFVLGIGQWLIIRPLCPVGLRWPLFTAGAAAGAWVLGLAPGVLSDLGLPGPAAMAVGMAAAPLILVSLGAAQALVLRRFVPRAYRWVGWTAAAWAAALPFSFVGPMLVPDEAPSAVALAAWGVSGIAMAATAAAITGAGMARMLATPGAAATAPG